VNEIADRSRRIGNAGARSRALAGALLAATLLGVFAVLAWRNSQPRTAFPYPNCTWEYHVLAAAASEKDEGFWRSYFLPPVYTPDYYAPWKTAVYTHLPPFSENVFGALLVAGVDTVHGLRWFPICLNVAALAALFAALALLKNRWFALLLVWAVLANPFFWMRAHGLYEYAFQLPHQALLLLGLAIYSRYAARWGIALAFLAAFWQGECTFVYQLQTYFIIIGFLLTESRERQRWYFLAALGGPAAFLLHFAQAALWLRSISSAVRDLFLIYLLRANASGPDVAHAANIPQYHSFSAAMADLARILSHETGIGGWFFAPAGFALALLALAALRKGERPDRANFIRCLFLFAGSMLWFLVMPEAFHNDRHAAFHQLSLALAVSLAVPVYAFGALAKEAVAGNRRAAPAAAVVGLVAATLCWLAGTDLKTYWQKERAILASYTEPGPRFEKSLLGVGRSVGLDGVEWVGLFSRQTPDAEKYRRRSCRENEGDLCRNPTQGLKFFAWVEQQPRAVRVRLTCAEPGDTRLAFRRVGPEEATGELLGETLVTHFAGGEITVPLAPLAGRIFTLTIGPEACASYVIERVIVD
jgi:hypothetical protein